jgi:HD-GYP domain-containing protein (c-di-GMP phosphodiesterase class II)
MQRLDILPWEANHPLNGHPCPVTGRVPYIENRWKVTRPDYRLKTGVLEKEVVLSLPVGHTKIIDTKAFFENLKLICCSPFVNASHFVLVEDYTFHTGSDYEGRLTYIRRMIDEIKPAGIIFITRSTNWRLSIQFGKVLYNAPFPIQCVSSYREALTNASEILERPLAGSSKVKTLDKIDNINFALSLELKTPAIVCVKYSGTPELGDLSSVAEFYMGLPAHPKLAKTFRIVHDLSGLTMPPLPILWKLIKMVLSGQYNNDDTCTIIKGSSNTVAFVIKIASLTGKDHLKVRSFDSCETACDVLMSELHKGGQQSGTLQVAALEMVEKIDWEKPGFYELEIVNNPELKPLALMLGAIKQDIDYYLNQRQKELETLIDVHDRARKLSNEIDNAYQRSEQDRISAESLSNENLALSLEIAKAQQEVFLVLSDYIDMRASLPVGSTKKLARFVSKIAEFFRYTPEECTRLHDATLLYHVGYLGISEHEENIKLHCSVGGEVLSNIYTFIMQYAAHIAHYHHEKWNGMGYPDHLIGDRIPREAQLIAIAEFLLAVPIDQFEFSLTKESGSSFDPEMVKTILLHREKVMSYLLDA